MSSNHEHPHPHAAHDESGTPRREKAPERSSGAALTAQAMCALLLLCGLWNATDTAVFLAFSRPTSGHVSRQRVVMNRFSYPPFGYVSNTYLEIAYSDRDGRHQSVVVSPAVCWFADKAHLPIRYDDGEPPRAKVCTLIGLWSKATMLVALGVGGWFFVGWVFR